MSSRSRASRRDAARASQSAATRRWVVPAVVAAVVVVGAVVAILATQGSTETSSVRPTGPSASVGAGSGTATSIRGASLVPLTDPGNDPAIGQPAPLVDGTSFDGRPVAIAADAKPKLILFLAHWCPHCQREVPLIQAWLDEAGQPGGVKLVSVATANDPTRPNYPPDAWLEGEGWTVPVIVDADNRIADAYGVSAFPFWVMVGADGRVADRATGELTIEQIQAAISSIGG
jgi:thiol-disulfide isomerase/thioredoxin